MASQQVEWRRETCIVHVDGFVISFRKEEGVVVDVARAGPPGKRGTLSIPSDVMLQARRIAHNAFHPLNAGEGRWSDPKPIAEDIVAGLPNVLARGAQEQEGEPWPKPQSPQQLEFLFPRVLMHPCADFQ